MGERTRPSARELPLGRTGSVWVAGSGDPLLLLHGWGLGPSAYLAGLTQLAALGFEVAAPTMAVVGRRWTIERAVHRVCKTLDLMGWSRAIVVGNSLGGAIAISTAAAHPRRVRLVALVDSLGLPLNRHLLGWALPFRRYATAGNWRALGAFAGNLLAGRGVGLLNLVQSALWAYGSGERLRADLGRVRRNRVPALVVWGEEDRLLPLSMGRELAAYLGAPLRVVPGAEHDWAVRHPDLFARELELSIRAVLDGRGGAGPVEAPAPRRRAAHRPPPPPPDAG